MNEENFNLLIESKRQSKTLKINLENVKNLNNNKNKFIVK